MPFKFNPLHGTFDLVDGDVFGPATATDNAIVRFDATTGKLIQNSTVTIGDNFVGAMEDSSLISGSYGVMPAYVIDGTTPTAISSYGAGLLMKGNYSQAYFVMGTEDNADTNGSAGIFISSGRATGTGQSGEVTIKTGQASGGGPSGDIDISTNSGGTNSSGDIYISTGAGNVSTGNIEIYTSNSAGTDGYVDIKPGNTAAVRFESPDATNIATFKPGSSDYLVRITAAGNLVPTNSALANTILIGDGAFSGIGGNHIIIGDGSTTTTDSIIIGNSTSGNVGSINIGHSGSGQANSISIGNNITALSNNISIGNNSSASSTSCMAIGDSAVASGNTSTALGSGTDATNFGTIAIGSLAQATGHSSIAIGANSNTNNFNSSQAYGIFAQTTAANQAVFHNINDVFYGPGVENSIPAGEMGINLTRQNTAVSNNAGHHLYLNSGNSTGSALGGEIRFKLSPAGASGNTQNSSQTYVAISADGLVRQDAITSQTVNMHEWQGSDVDGRMAINPEGRLILDHDTYTDVLAVGAGSDVTGNNAMSLGSNATAGLDAMAIGANSSCTGTDSLSIGIGVSHTRNQSVAIGTSTTTVNGVQSIAIGDGANAAGGSCIAIGYTATTGINLGLAIGWEANSTGTISSALGPGCDALALFSSCVGVNTTVESGNSVACGPFANIGTSANQSVAIGNSATVNNNASQGVAIGNSAVVGAGDVGSMAFGAGASTTAANQLLLGGTTGVTDAYIGKGVTNATPLSITVQPTGETGTDSTNTADFHLAGSKGTGTGTGGSVKIQVGVAGTTGTTLNTLEDVVVITSDKSTELKGGVVKPVLTVTAANTTLSATDYHVLCDASSNTVTIDLPAAASHTGREYSIKAIDVTSSVTVDGNGSETIDGSLTQVLPLNATMKIISNGTGWFII